MNNYIMDTSSNTFAHPLQDQLSSSSVAPSSSEPPSSVVSEPPSSAVSEPPSSVVSEPPQVRLVDTPVTDNDRAILLIMMFVQLAQKRGAFNLEESAKIWECLKRFQ